MHCILKKVTEKGGTLVFKISFNSWYIFLHQKLKKKYSTEIIDLECRYVYVCSWASKSIFTFLLVNLDFHNLRQFIHTRRKKSNFRFLAWYNKCSEIYTATFEFEILLCNFIFLSCLEAIYWHLKKGIWFQSHRPIWYILCSLSNFWYFFLP